MAVIRRLALVVLGLAVTLPACGKRGDPLPPLPRTPKPVTSVRLSQRGGELELSYLVPRTTTGGVVLPLVEIQVLRADAEGDINKVGRPRTRRAAPGEALVDTEPLPAAGTKLRFAVRAISRGKPSPLSEEVRIEVVPPPPAPLALKAEVTVRGVSLAWQGVLPPLPLLPSPAPAASPVAAPSPAAKASAPAAVPTAGALPDAKPSPAVVPAPATQPDPVLPAGNRPGHRPPPAAAAAAAPEPVAVPSRSGFFVYRRAATGTYAAPLAQNPVRALAYEDITAKPGESWCYVVRSATSTEPLVESAASNEVCQTVGDVDPPAAPAGLQVQMQADGAHLVWSPSPEHDVATYEVYRSVDGSEPESIARIGVEEQSFVDPQPPPGRRLQYSLRATDSAGNWSPFSRAAEVRR